MTTERVPTNDKFLYVLFAGIGGSIGGAAPDWLEPGIHPNHRNVFHSLLVGGGITAAALADCQAFCHRASMACLHRAQCAPPGSSARETEQLKATGWTILAGLIVGFLAGYVSHLALDARTAKSLPLLFNRF